MGAWVLVASSLGTANGEITDVVSYNTSSEVQVTVSKEVASVSTTMTYDGYILVYGTFVGTASTNTTLTSVVKLDDTAQHTVSDYVAGAAAHTINFSHILGAVSASTYTVSVDMASSDGTFTLDDNEQSLFTANYYAVIPPEPPAVYPVYELLADTIIEGSSVTSLSIAGLNINTDEEILLVSEIYNDAATSITPRLYINADTTETNYYSQVLSCDGTTLTGARVNSSRFSTAGGSDFGLSYTNIKISENGYPAWQSRVTFRYGSAIQLVDYHTVAVNTVSTIDTLVIVSNTASSIKAGSRFQLYKKGAVV